MRIINHGEITELCGPTDIAIVWGHHIVPKKPGAKSAKSSEIEAGLMGFGGQNLQTHHGR